MKLFYVAVMSLLLGGCASTSLKDISVCKQSAETIRKFGRDTSVTNEVTNVDDSKKSEFYESTSSKIFSGIKSANLNKTFLTLTILDSGLFEKYSAPIVNSTNKIQYEAHPFTGTFTPVGIFVWLFNPTAMNNFTFGCTESSLSSKPDMTRKIKTGKSEWRNVQKTHTFLISGFDKNYEQLSHWDEVDFDLTPYILNTDLTKKTTLKITCLDCDLLGLEEQNLYKDVLKTIEFNADFRVIKANLLAEERTRKDKNINSDKEELNLRELQAKEDLKVERQTVPFDKSKTQCKELGFKAGMLCR